MGMDELCRRVRQRKVWGSLVLVTGKNEEKPLRRQNLLEKGQNKGTLLLLYGQESLCLHLSVVALLDSPVYNIK